LAYDAPFSPRIVEGIAPLHTRFRTVFTSGIVAKRAFDYVLAILALILVLPVAAVIYCLVRLDGGPCFFEHARIGEGGKPFRCLKFRTMVPDSAEALSLHLSSNPQAAMEWAETCKLKDDPRITRVGRLLRSASLDELPQLINILRGEMSLVGPRPITEEEAARYGSAIGLYHAVRPGITGLWQIGGRSSLSYERRVQLDSQYVLERTLWIDLLIVVKTIPAVLSRDGAH